VANDGRAKADSAWGLWQCGAMETIDHSIRVTFVQPALAKYRIPVFHELARRPGIDLQIVYGAVAGLSNVEADGFKAIATPLRESRGWGPLVSFHGSEWKYCSRRFADVVVLRWSPRSITLLPALVRARAAGLPTVLWGHGYSKDERGKRFGPRQWIARWASALVFYEPSTREAYIRDGWNPDQLFVALNSVDHTDIESARNWWLARPDQLADFRQKNGINDGPVILFVSRLQRANRIDLLIEATAELAGEIPGLKTVIIGNGPEEKQRLESLALATGAADNVVFQAGIYDEQKLAPWFLSSTVFCYPANVGLSLIHALWYGLPVVTSDNRSSQNPEIVALEHGVNGLRYRHLSVPSLVSALREVITNTARQTSMSEAARRTAEERFTIPRMVDGMEAAIRYAHAGSRGRN
jgi:glycosyltransferase involved in cell wall biosynthesis